MSEFLHLKNIEKRFKVSDKQEYIALSNVNLKMKRNETISIIGHRGCGKSTLVNIISGLLKQTTGNVILNGKETTTPGPDRIVLFQDHSLLPWLSVYENIEMALKKVMPELYPEVLSEKIEKFISMVELQEVKDKLPIEISQEMQQRAGIARALSISPDIILMDEPFGAVDALTRSDLQEHLIRIQQDVKQTMMIITHDIDEAILLSDRVIMMTNGPESTIGEILEVNLSRPRNRVTIQHNPEYIRCREAIMHFLYEKLVKQKISDPSIHS